MVQRARSIDQSKAGKAVSAAVVLRRPKAAVSEGDAPRTDADGIYQFIAAAIREQRLTPGTKLGEEQLGRIFGVGRPVVRAVLMRLAHDNVVEIRPNRGAFIATPTDAQTREVFEARRIVEAMAARACAEKATKRDIARLRQHIAVEAQAWKTNQRDDWIRLTGEFHLLLADIVGNAEIRRFLAELVAKTSLIIALFGGVSKSSCPEDHHSKIVAAIGTRDADAAERIMLAHLHECEAGLQINAPQMQERLEVVFANARRRPRRGA